ncbi:hypothetical protein BDZ89DRAFT_1141826 [Hymenopellis radicata]|nr:hypothetical protein BDZ89DRAFT_1141826 [Hymenopellis radicata]
MSGLNDVSQFSQYDPNAIKEYRLSPAENLLSPLVIDTPLPLNDFPDPLGSPYSSTSLSGSLRLLHLNVQESPDIQPTAPRLSKWDHVTAVLECISQHFPAFGDFAEAFSEPIRRDDPDPRSSLHISVLSAWLSGRNRFRPADFIQAIYSNRFSVPRYDAVHADELDLAFNAEHDVATIHFARIALSVWATKLVGRRCALEVGKLAKEDPDDPDFRVHLQASANERMKSRRRLVAEEDIYSFSLMRTASMLKKRATATWYITECMAATRSNGAVIIRDKRPHPLIQAAAISSFALARNKSANGYFALPIAVWLFATKAHIDIKRAMSRLGLAQATAAALENKEPYCRKVLDNIQQYQIVHEPGVGKSNKLITGTAATAIRLDDCEPGAFDLDDYQERVVRNERAELTTTSLFADIDFAHLQRVQVLHVVRILCEHVPCLDHLRPLISARFRSDPIQKHRMREGRKSSVIPLRANSHYEMDPHGMHQAEKDFDTQTGHTPEAVSKARVMVWDAGDGGSVLSGWNVKRNLFSQAVSLNVYHSFESRIWTTDIWHVKANMLNAFAVNYCRLSINSSVHVTCDCSDEIFVSSTYHIW